MIEDLTRLLYQEAIQSNAEHSEICARARKLAAQADWSIFYRGYSARTEKPWIRHAAALIDWSAATALASLGYSDLSSIYGRFECAKEN